MCPLGMLELLWYDNVSYLVGIRQVGVSIRGGQYSLGIAYFDGLCYYRC